LDLLAKFMVIFLIDLVTPLVLATGVLKALPS
jgi:hypothetical protein